MLKETVYPLDTAAFLGSHRADDLTPALPSRPAATDNGHGASKTVRVVLVDDSPGALRLLQKLLNDPTQLHIVGTASHGREALELLKTLRPDVLCTDDAMPVMDGLELTRRAMSECPLPILVLGEAATLTSERRAAFLAAGAVDVGPKPSADLAFESLALERASREMVARVRRLAGVVVLSRRLPSASSPSASSPSASSLSGAHPTMFASSQGTLPHGTSPPTAIPSALPPFSREATRAERVWIPSGGASVSGGVTALTGTASSRVGLVAVGSSTGGPHALEMLLSALSSDFAAPILCVQHISLGFSQGLIDWLNARCALHVTRAQPGLKPQAGTVYFAPEEAHLVLDASGRMQFSSAPLEDGHRPSATMLLRSVARHCGTQAAGIVLTGMGGDGAQGLLELAQAGGLTFAQDEASCVVYGMPAQAARLGAARYIMSPSAIALELTRRVR